MSHGSGIAAQGGNCRPGVSQPTRAPGAVSGVGPRSTAGRRCSRDDPRRRVLGLERGSVCTPCGLSPTDPGPWGRGRPRSRVDSGIGSTRPGSAPRLCPPSGVASGRAATAQRFGTTGGVCAVEARSFRQEPPAGAGGVLWPAQRRLDEVVRNGPRDLESRLDQFRRSARVSSVEPRSRDVDRGSTTRRSRCSSRVRELGTRAPARCLRFARRRRIGPRRSRSRSASGPRRAWLDSVLDPVRLPLPPALRRSPTLDPPRSVHDLRGGIVDLGAATESRTGAARAGAGGARHSAARTGNRSGGDPLVQRHRRRRDLHTESGSRVARAAAGCVVGSCRQRLGPVGHGSLVAPNRSDDSVGRAPCERVCHSHGCLDSGVRRSRLARGICRPRTAGLGLQAVRGSHRSLARVGHRGAGRVVAAVVVGQRPEPGRLVRVAADLPTCSAPDRRVGVAARGRALRSGTARDNDVRSGRRPGRRDPPDVGWSGRADRRWRLESRGGGAGSFVAGSGASQIAASGRHASVPRRRRPLSRTARSRAALPRRRTLARRRVGGCPGRGDPSFRLRAGASATVRGAGPQPLAPGATPPRSLVTRGSERRPRRRERQRSLGCDCCENGGGRGPVDRGHRARSGGETLAVVAHEPIESASRPARPEGRPPWIQDVDHESALGRLSARHRSHQCRSTQRLRSSCKRGGPTTRASRCADPTDRSARADRFPPGAATCAGPVLQYSGGSPGGRWPSRRRTG